MREEIKATAVAELQGLDGAFSFAERLLQRIWAKRDFDFARARTADGRPVRVLKSGIWNSRGGPDFRQARIEIGDEKLSGDVELHLHASDWAAHGHSSDSNFNQVVLHVVLFPPANVYTEGAGGRTIPVLALLPLLYRSLEEYADDEAVERLANHPLARAQESLLKLTPAEQLFQLRRGAEERWETKLGFARRRIERLGWDDACHQTALEILGYRFNRGPMIALATKYSLENWPSVAKEERLVRLLAEFEERWYRQAVRPANHPKTRLEQYERWTTHVQSWPEKLRSFAEKLSSSESRDLETAEFRKLTGMPELWEMARCEICGEAVGGTRFRTLMCDGFLPLLAARDARTAASLRLYWFHGYAGDIPENISRVLRALNLCGGAKNPLNHGLAQGLLSWCWRDEEQKQQTTACP